MKVAVRAINLGAAECLSNSFKHAIVSEPIIPCNTTFGACNATIYSIVKAFAGFRTNKRIGISRLR